MNKRKMIMTFAVAAAVLASGCASGPAPAASAAVSEPAPVPAAQSTFAQNAPGSQTATASEEAKRTADRQRVIDWANRGLGEDASPAWLLPALRGNFRVLKQDWQIRDDKVLKVGVSRAPALNAAQTIADVQYAARLANQLKQAVTTKAAITLGGDDQFFVVNDAETRYERERSEAEFAAEIRAQQEALRSPVSSAARRDAYRSGDPAKIAAAGVTKDDTDYIAALAAIAGIE